MNGIKESVLFMFWKFLGYRMIWEWKKSSLVSEQGLKSLLAGISFGLKQNKKARYIKTFYVTLLKKLDFEKLMVWFFNFCSRAKFLLNSIYHLWLP